MTIPGQLSQNELRLLTTKEAKDATMVAKDSTMNRTKDTTDDTTKDTTMDSTKDTDLETGYDLVGVIDYEGSLHAGHYTARCKSAVDQHWYSCNDTCITPVGFNGNASSKPYMLFYRRVASS